MQSSLLIRICPTTMHAVNVISVENFPGICYFSFVIKCNEVIILKVVFYLVFCSRKYKKKFSGRCKATFTAVVTSQTPLFTAASATKSSQT